MNLKDVFIIIKGHSISQYGGFKDVWESSSELSCYYESKYSAEMYLANNGYEKDCDGVYFLMDTDENNQVIAKIIPLAKRY